MLIRTKSSEHTLRSRPEELQVEASHYYRSGYNSPERLYSFQAQIQYAREVRPQSVVEIGPGSGYVTRALRSKGIAVTTVDIDPSLEPDVVASVTDLPSTLPPADVVLCCQVLEHLPWRQFRDICGALYRLSRQRLIMSLPDVSPYVRVACETELRRIIRRRVIDVPSWLAARRSIRCDEHCWEIGVWESGITAATVSRKIATVTKATIETWRLFECPYHRFFQVSRS